jgi:hypothetical protein
MAKIDFKQAMAQRAQASMDNGLIQQEGIKNNICILDELKDLIKPLQSAEFEQLTENIIRNGCQDTLKIWHTSRQVIEPQASNNEDVYVLIDGHNRYSICKQHSIPFNLSLMNFESLADVKDYMILLQLGRRNVTKEEVAYYTGKLYGRSKYGTLMQKEDGSSAKKTAELIAEQYNMNEKTIRRNEEYAKGLDTLSEELRGEVLQGKVKIPKATIQKLATVSEDEPKITSIEAIQVKVADMDVNSSDTGETVVLAAFQEDVSQSIPIEELYSTSN